MSFETCLNYVKLGDAKMAYWYIINFIIDGPFEAFEIAGPIRTQEDFDECNGQMGYDIGVFEADSEEEALELAYTYDSNN